MVNPTQDEWNGAPLIPAALTVGREFRGMTQVELAQRSGVARQQIASIEKGAVRQPTGLTVRALAAALDLHPAFLTRAPAHGPSAAVLHFRGKARVTKRDGARLLALARIWTGFVGALARRCTRLPGDAISSIDTTEDIEKVAAKARTIWGLREDTPIHNVARLLERAGAFVGTFQGGEKGIDAFSWQAEAPQVLCNIDRSGPSRTRFNLMHEAAHLILHRGRVTGDEESETEANRFASAVLLPRRAFWQEFPRHGSRLNWDGMFRMKQRWGVSVQAIVSRAYDLGIINAAEYKRAFVFISSKGWRTEEPGEPELSERPELVPRILESLARVQGTIPADIGHELGIPVSVISGMAGVDVGVLGALGQRHPIVRIGMLGKQTNGLQIKRPAN